MSQAGLMVSVIGQDCTGGGVTSGRRHAVLVGPMFPEIFAARDDMPALEVEVDENPRGVSCGYLAVLEDRSGPRIVRVRVKPAGKSPGMFGGHYVETSDSRFPFSGPIPVFDRYEERELREVGDPPPSEAKVLDGEVVEEERPGHDAPMPTREAHTAEDFDRALGLYLEGVKAIKAAYYDRMGYAHGAGELFDFDVVADKPGPRFIRVVNMEARGNGSSRFLERASVYSFVERATGDVYKPESFTKPAKHVRSNIFSAKHGTERHNWHGPEYLR